MDRNQRHARLSWLFVAAMLFLCATLGVLQYRWIDEASRAESARLRGSLQASLLRLGTSFNSDLVNACAALLPRGFPPDADVPESEYATLYSNWKDASQHDRLFSAIALARPDGPSFSLSRLNLDTATFAPAPWPEAWRPLQSHLESHFLQPGQGREVRPGPGPGPGGGGGRFRAPNFDDGLLIELPRRRGPQPEWLIFEVNPDYVRSTLLPELLARHLGSSLSDYQVEVVSRQDPSQVIFRSPNDASVPIGNSADASTLLFDVSWEQIFRRTAPPGLRGMMRGRPPSGDWGRWQLRVRHRSGSLDAAVAAARLRNLAVTAAILLLMLATVGSLTLFTRRAQRLATLQMNFVAGVSHELRTPLTVIRTAAFNLRGKLAQNPAQVEKYGSLIQQESERLTDIVEQVLQFASNQAGPVRRQFEPLSAESLIDGSLTAAHSVLEAAHCAVEKDVQPDLPLVLGDPVALKHALQNLIANAAKYGASPGGWIGISALPSAPGFVEIRVSDRGPGIPPDELSSIFDPFFRGQRPVQDQIHGTGLGLALVKGIAEAHGGSVSASSVPGSLTQFSLRLPGVPA